MDASLPKASVGLADVVQIAASGNHACALRKDATVLCWGHNHRGQLGSQSGSRCQENGTGPQTPCSATPLPVAGLADVTHVAAGSNHSCALLKSGAVHCWGDNLFQQLGGRPRQSSLPAAPVPGLHDVTKIALGDQHSCALIGAGEVYCWGGNTHGQLGDGSSVDRALPVKISLPRKAVAIELGYGQTCAVLSDGTVYCWGGNLYGQLGDGTTHQRLLPGAVSGLEHVLAIAVGSSHACAIVRGGALRCWGAGESGQLGDGGAGSRRYQALPVSIPMPNASLQVTAGSLHTCVLNKDGQVRCFGDNAFGQLGDGSTQRRLVPTLVKELP